MVRKATDGDLREVAEKCCAPIYDQADQQFPYDIEGWISGWERIIRAECGVMLVRYWEGELAGAMGVVFYPDINSGMKRSGEIMWYVRPAFRGKGVGRSLYDAFVLESKHRGVRILTMGALESNDSSEVLDGFYRSEGFRPVERVYQKELWEAF